MSAAQLAAYAAAVDAADAALAVAKQNLAQAEIVSPIAGVVSSVGVTVGQSATAGSSTDAIDVVSSTSHSVVLAVDVTKIASVKVGDKATVIPDGRRTSLPAVVSYVAAAPSTSGGTSYTVRLSFVGSPAGLYDGIQAAATIVVADVANVVAVPTSAIHHLGTASYVTVLADGTAKQQLVTVGATGATYTQVTKGLTVGEEVVLANLSAAIPTSTTTTNRFGGATGLGSGAGLGGGTGLGGTGATGGFGGPPAG